MFVAVTVTVAVAVGVVVVVLVGPVSNIYQKRKHELSQHLSMNNCD
jgi:F0F1-type ATP synthase membrane subunit b/b'